MTDKKQADVLRHFQQGGTLTVFECWQMFHTSELRRVVSRLRKAGYAIIGQKEDGCTYKRYRMVG